MDNGIKLTNEDAALGLEHQLELVSAKLSPLSIEENRVCMDDSSRHHLYAPPVRAPSLLDHRAD